MDIMPLEAIQLFDSLISCQHTNNMAVVQTSKVGATET